ncbi:MAG: sensor histidine kinase [Chryseolinea sp.]
MAGPSEYQIGLLIAAGTVGMLLLAIAIILFMVFYQKRMIEEQYNRQKLELAYQQKMMDAALESQESERKRVAGDLHDSLGGMLSAVRVGITTLARQLPNPQVLEQQKYMIDETINTLRSISRDLMPSTLEKFGLVHALRELCEQLHKTTMMPITFNEHGEFERLAPKKELMVFRIAQELTNNAVKHAQARSINVILSGSSKLEMAIEDDGVGFDAEAQRTDRKFGKGLGLFNIENRARLLNGKLEYTSTREKGSKIILTMPL